LTGAHDGHDDGLGAGCASAGQDYLAQHISGAKKHVIKGSSHSTLFYGTEENCRVVIAFLKREF